MTMKPNKKPIVSFYGKILYDIALPKEHPFRVLLKVIDWKSIRNELLTDEAGQPIEHAETGRPAYDPLIPFKMLLLQRWHPASDVKVEERAKTDLAYRFFLQVSIEEPIPDATTLSKYRTRWGEVKLKRVHKNVFRQVRAHGFGQVAAGLVGDTTHQYARIQKPSARNLLLDCFEKWTNELQALGQQFSEVIVVDQSDFRALILAIQAWFVEYNEQIQEKTWSRKERFSQLVTKVLETQELVESLLRKLVPPVVTTSKAWQAFQARDRMLKRLLEENVSQNGDKIHQKRGDRKVISLVDPEARSGQKSKTIRFTGYKVAVSMTKDRFYPDVETLPGNESDMGQAVPIVTRTMEVSGEVPTAVALDLGFNSVANRVALHALGVQPGIDMEPRRNSRDPGMFTADQFQFDPQTMTVTCPAGETTPRFTTNLQTDQFVFRFSKALCGSCALQDQCTHSKTGRTVQFSRHLEVLKVDQQFLETPAYEELRRARWCLEAGFGSGKSSHGLRSTPYRGLSKTRLHNYLVFTVLNIKRLLKLLSVPSVSIRPSGTSV